MATFDIRSQLTDLYWRSKDSKKAVIKISDNPEAYFIYAPKHTDRIYVDVYIRSGISIEEEPYVGAGHLLEHHIAEHLVQNLSADLNSNARIDHEHIYFYAKIEKNKPKEIVEKFLDQVFLPSFDNSEILSYEKPAILNELNTNAHSLTKRIERIVEKNRFSKPCRALVPFEDSLATTKDLTLERIKEHHKSICTDSNVKIFFSGSRPHPSLTNYLRGLVKKYKLPKGKRVEFPDCSYSDRGVFRTKDEMIKGTYVYLTFPCISANRPFKDKMILRILLDLITGRDRTYGINKFARQEGIYGINYYWMRMEKLGILALYSYVPKEDISRLLGVIGRGIKTIKTEPIDAAFLKRKIDNYMGIYRRDWRSNERVDWIIHDLLEYNVVKDLDFYISEMKKITPNDIQAAARRIFTGNTLNLTLYGELPTTHNDKLLEMLGC